MSYIGQEASDLSDAQSIILSVASIPPALLSMCGSSLIIYMVMQKRSKKSIGRILIGMSICDIISTISICLQGFLSPKDASQRITSLGNDTSCNALGFLWQVCYITFWYNGLLSFYYLTTIVSGWSEERFKRYEPYLHGLCVGFNVITASLGTIFEWYAPNQIGHGCWVNDYPRNCGDEPHESGEECLSEEIAWIIGGIPIVFLVVTILVNNCRIYWHVRTTIFRSQRNSIVGNLDSQSRRIRGVAIQCFLYVLAFWCTAVPAIIVRNLEATGFSASNESSIFPILLLQSIAAPSTGFFNLMVYLRPQYMRCREDFPDQSRLWAFRRAVFGSIVNPIESTESFRRRFNHRQNHTTTLSSNMEAVVEQEPTPEKSSGLKLVEQQEQEPKQCPASTFQHSAAQEDTTEHVREESSSARS